METAAPVAGKALICRFDYLICELNNAVIPLQHLEFPYACCLFDFLVTPASIAVELILRWLAVEPSHGRASICREASIVLAA